MPEWSDKEVKAILTESASAERRMAHGLSPGNLARMVLDARHAGDTELWKAYQKLVANPVESPEQMPEPFRTMYWELNTVIYDSMAFTAAGASSDYVDILADKLTLACMELKILRERLSQ